jgi:hypothetical protein
MSILVHIYLTKSLLLLLTRATGIRRNPEKYRNSCPTGIPAKNSCKIRKKQEFLRPLQNHALPKNSSGKHRKKKILRNPVRNTFLGPKNIFLKRGITNLGKIPNYNGIASWKTCTPGTHGRT